MRSSRGTGRLSTTTRHRNSNDDLDIDGSGEQKSDISARMKRQAGEGDDLCTLPFADWLHLYGERKAIFQL